jgi:hypothetical protein
MADRRPREQVERLVVGDSVAVEHAAVAVVRVLAEADVGQERQPRNPGAQRAERPLDDAVVVPGPRPFGVLLLRDAEQEHRAHAGARELRALAHHLVDRALRDPGQSLDRADDAFARAGEERHHDVVERQRRLADECAQRVGPSEATKAGRGEAHGHKGIRRDAPGAATTR